MIKDKKINSFQMFVLGSFIANALFVGLGNIILVISARENTWIIGIISLFLGIIPIILLNKIFDYEPNLNIFDKNKKLFNKKIGLIVNLILVIIVLAILVMNIWSITNFANTKYLTETPFLFIAFMLMIPAIYANIKGIESIARTSEILFYFAIIIHFTITSSLLKFVKIDNLKPILDISINTIITCILKFLSYILVPFITLTVIPKNNITDKKNLKKSLILGYILGAFFMILVFFMTMSILGIDLLSLYRYPEYYVIKKVSIGNAIDNVENFLSVHWMFNLIVTIMLNLYFISEFIFNNFKVKNLTRKLIIIFIGIVTIFISNKIFINTTIPAIFMNNSFLTYIAVPLVIILLFMFVIIKFKEKKNKT